METARMRVSVPGLGEAPASDLRTGFRNGFVFELLDVRHAQPLHVHVMVLNPQRYELTEPHQSVLTPSEANNVVDESVGIITRQIMLEGTYGAADKRATGFQGAQKGGAPMSGADHFRDLRDLFRQYSALKQDANKSAFTRLIFHALRDDDHFVVAKPSFSIPRDSKSSRMHYTYRIQMEAIADASLISRLRRASAANGFDPFFTDQLRVAVEALNDARAFFADVTATIGEVKRKVANIQAVMIQAAGLINAVSNAVRAGRDLVIDYPLHLAANVIDSVSDMADRVAALDVNNNDDVWQVSARNLQRLEDSLHRLVAHAESFGGKGRISTTFRQYQGEQLLTQQDYDAGTGGATAGSLVRVASGSEGAAGLDAPSFRGVQTVRLTRTDTLESLAARFSVLPEWLIAINDLSPPYILPGGGPGILAPGDLILIPTRTGNGSGGESSDTISIEDMLYGVDLAIDMPLLESEGVLDLREPIAGDAGDADLVRGVANVIQGTAITIHTERGSTAFLPDVGISRNVGVKGTVQHMLLAAVNLREAILSDTRIEGIRDSEIVLDGDVLTQEITPVLTGQQDDVTMILPFGRGV